MCAHTSNYMYYNSANTCKHMASSATGKKLARCVGVNGHNFMYSVPKLTEICPVL